MEGKAPFKNVLVNDLLLDAEGKKMSKSRGNIVEPFATIKEYGADTVRFYLPYVSPVWTPLKFDMDGLKEVYSKFFNPLKNTYNFFVTYANIDDIDITSFKVPASKREEIDRWLLSKYNGLVKKVTEAFDEYDLNKVVRALSLFVSEDLSNWYIRRNRDRFWGSELTLSKKSVYLTTYEVLVGLSKLMAPIVPFLSEELYRNLTGEESVHLADYPVCKKSLIDETIEEKMDLVRDLISLGRNAREEVRIKVRQPLSQVIIDGKYESVVGDLTNLIQEELNVKEVLFANDLSTYMEFEIKPNFKVCGKIFGSNMKAFQEELAKLNNEQVTSLANGATVSLTVAGTLYDVDATMVDVRIHAKEGFDAAHSGNLFVILNTTLTKDLLDEGIVRELISKVQQLRKSKDFEVADRITLYYRGDEEFTSIVTRYQEMIQSETLATEITFKEDLSEEYDLNGKKVFLDAVRR